MSETVPSADTEELAMFRGMVLRFLEQEVAPHFEAWEEAGMAPRELWQKMGAAGMLCVDLPEEFGAANAGYSVCHMIIEELARLGYAGISSGYNIHANIVAPYLMHIGTPAQQDQWLPRMISGGVNGSLA